MTTRSELRALVAKWGPQPWTLSSSGLVLDADGRLVILTAHTELHGLMVAAVNALPGLLDELDAKDAELRAIEAARDADFQRIRELAARVAELEGERAELWAALDKVPPEGEVSVPEDPNPIPRRRRLAGCVERWPECSTGDYDPRCCRFPKSCSCEVYDDDRVTDDELEPKS